MAALSQVALMGAVWRRTAHTGRIGARTSTDSVGTASSDWLRTEPSISMLQHILWSVSSTSHIPHTRSFFRGAFQSSLVKQPGNKAAVGRPDPHAHLRPGWCIRRNGAWLGRPKFNHFIGDAAGSLGGLPPKALKAPTH